jgi:hypothetical protein
MEMQTAGIGWRPAMNEPDLLILILGCLTIPLFSLLALRAEQKLWMQCRRDEARRILQRKITEGKAHAR